MSSPAQQPASGQAVDALALATIAPIEPGMTVGLGTGRTSKRVIRALAERVRAESLPVTLVSTSEDSTRFAQNLGLTVREFSDVERVDYLFDGGRGDPSAASSRRAGR